jgi:6-phosphogluconolactonase (cycloisomerase 2 family)
MNRRLALSAIIALAIAGCSDGRDVAGPPGSLEPQFASNASGGDVYTSTNSASGNEVWLYHRENDGSLTFTQAFATGGTGTGMGLGNQGALSLSGNGRFLIVVNAGSNDVSVFTRRPDGTLDLRDRVASGGTMPISVTQNGRWVYVLNAGGDGNIAGFSRNGDGQLSPIAGSIQPLSQAGGTGPAQISFNNKGSQLVVTEKMTNRIDVYAVSNSGVAGAAVVNESDGATPFGFAFDARDHLIVSNAAGGMPGLGSATAYIVRSNGTLEALAGGPVPNGQTAPCWVVVARNGHHAYVTNTGSSNTTGYDTTPLSLLDGSGVSGANTGAPIDAAITQTGQEYLYVLNAGSNTIDGFAVNADGSLSLVSGGASGLPAGTSGLIAY